MCPIFHQLTSCVPCCKLEQLLRSNGSLLISSRKLYQEPPWVVIILIWKVVPSRTESLYNKFCLYNELYSYTQLMANIFNENSPISQFTMCRVIYLGRIYIFLSIILHNIQCYNFCNSTPNWQHTQDNFPFVQIITIHYKQI